MIYFDHAATTMPYGETAVNLVKICGNPSSAHFLGQRARDELEDARGRIARRINAEPDEIIFTSGATEACAMVAQTLIDEGFSQYNLSISPYEHHAVTENMKRIPTMTDRNVSYKYPMMAYCQMLVNNETGEIFTMPEKHGPNDLVFCDATAAMGHIPIDVKALGVDYLCASAHKFGGVPGAGFLYARRGAPLSPLIRGAQEHGYRGGTENVPAILSMAAALDMSTGDMVREREKYIAMRDYMIETVKNDLPDTQINTPLGNAAPHILNLSFPGVENTALVLLASSKGLCVSAGAACSNGLNEPSATLMAMFDDERRARSAIRISFGWQNADGEAEEAAGIIINCVRKLRSMRV